MSKVYRIQDHEGRGPFKPGLTKYWANTSKDELSPFYVEFSEIPVSGLALRCGCTSVDQLKLWFTPHEYGRLLGFGYKCVIIENAKIHFESEIQCLFEKGSKPKVIDLYCEEEYAA